MAEEDDLYALAEMEGPSPNIPTRLRAQGRSSTDEGTEDCFQVTTSKDQDELQLSLSRLAFPSTRATARSTVQEHTGNSRKDHYRLFLMGITGSGKSTTGNTILGANQFGTSSGFSSETTQCKLRMVDSPGLYDTHQTQEQTCTTLVKYLASMYPGPHAILYVIAIGRYMEAGFGAYERLLAIFDENICKHMIVVFTHGDKLKEGDSIEEAIAASPQTLQQVLNACDDRYIVFNNFAIDPQPQVERLLQMVNSMVAGNGGRPYSCPKYRELEDIMEQEVASRLEEIEKRDLKRQQYVKMLEKKLNKAKEEAHRAKQHFRKNEEDRKLEREASDRWSRRRELSLQLDTNDQQLNFQRQRTELQREQEKRASYERAMMEKHMKLTEMERRIAEEQVEKMKERERLEQTRLQEQEARARAENEKLRQQLDQERQEMRKQQQEQYKRESERMEMLDAKMNELLEAMSQQLEAGKKEAERKDEEIKTLKRRSLKRKMPVFPKCWVKQQNQRRVFLPANWMQSQDGFESDC